jgi:ribosome-associated translation inhibitor RaiA
LNIRVTGRTEDVTSGMKQKAQQKVSKLLRFYDRITWVDVVLGGDKERRVAEVTAGLSRGNTVVGRQLRKHKEKLKDHRPRRAGSSEAPPEESEGADDEDLYEDL